jgi:hypothetical protein
MWSSLPEANLAGFAIAAGVIAARPDSRDRASLRPGLFAVAESRFTHNGHVDSEESEEGTHGLTEGLIVWSPGVRVVGRPRGQ